MALHSYIQCQKVDFRKYKVQFCFSDFIVFLLHASVFVVGESLHDHCDGFVNLLSPKHLTLPQTQSCLSVSDCAHIQQLPPTHLLRSASDL